MLGFRCLALGCLLLAASTTRAETSTPLNLLENMSRAGQTLSYQGSFTYEHSASMESFRILHWIDDGQTHEYLEYLNGPDTALQRLGRVDGCLPIGLRLLQNRMEADANSEATQPGRIEDHYQLRFREDERIAGRDARVVEVRPRDELRYGYLLGIDEASGLLLKSVLIDEEQRVLERFQFVDLDLNPPLDELRERAADGSAAPKESGNCDNHSSEPSRWTLNWVPPGFVYSGERQLADNVEMLMYTDGLASFSIFLQPVSGGAGIEGWAKRGATSAYMGQVTVGTENDSTSYRVTVVGEIPGKVAEQLARGIRTLNDPRRMEP